MRKSLNIITTTHPLQCVIITQSSTSSLPLPPPPPLPPPTGTKTLTNVQCRPTASPIDSRIRAFFVTSAKDQGTREEDRSEFEISVQWQSISNGELWWSSYVHSNGNRIGVVARHMSRRERKQKRKPTGAAVVNDDCDGDVDEHQHQYHGFLGRWFCLVQAPDAMIGQLTSANVIGKVVKPLAGRFSLVQIWTNPHADPSQHRGAALAPTIPGQRSIMRPMPPGFPHYAAAAPEQGPQKPLLAAKRQRMADGHVAPAEYVNYDASSSSVSSYSPTSNSYLGESSGSSSSSSSSYYYPSTGPMASSLASDRTSAIASMTSAFSHPTYRASTCSRVRQVPQPEPITWVPQQAHHQMSSSLSSSLSSSSSSSLSSSLLQSAALADNMGGADRALLATMVETVGRLQAQVDGLILFVDSLQTQLLVEQKMRLSLEAKLSAVGRRTPDFHSSPWTSVSGNSTGGLGVSNKSDISSCSSSSSFTYGGSGDGDSGAAASNGGRLNQSDPSSMVAAAAVDIVSSSVEASAAGTESADSSVSSEAAAAPAAGGDSYASTTTTSAANAAASTRPPLSPADQLHLDQQAPQHNVLPQTSQMELPRMQQTLPMQQTNVQRLPVAPAQMSTASSTMQQGEILSHISHHHNPTDEQR